MPVLLLAQGDVKAKDLLKKAIAARYGINPPVVENLRIDFKGRARVKVGPIGAWVPLEITAFFRFPTHMRWDFIVKPGGIQVQRGIEAFDGESYRRLRGSSTPSIINDEEAVKSIRRRLWAIAALLLTPLGEHFVKLDLLNDLSLDAENTQLHDAVNLQLRADNTLERVQVPCLNPDTDRKQNFIIKLSENQAPVDQFMMPHKVYTFWDDEPYFEVEPVRAMTNQQFSDALFRLEG